MTHHLDSQLEKQEDTANSKYNTYVQSLSVQMHSLVPRQSPCCCLLLLIRTIADKPTDPGRRHMEEEA